MTGSAQKRYVQEGRRFAHLSNEALQQAWLRAFIGSAERTPPDVLEIIDLQAEHLLRALPFATEEAEAHLRRMTEAFGDAIAGDAEQRAHQSVPSLD